MQQLAADALRRTEEDLQRGLGGSLTDDSVNERVEAKREEQDYRAEHDNGGMRRDLELEAERLRSAELERRLNEVELVISRLTKAGHSVTPDAAVAETLAEERRKAKDRFYRKLLGRTIRLTIHPTDDPNKNFDVSLCLNGQVVRLPRGKVVEAPGWVVPLLDECTVDTIVKTLNERGQPEAKRLFFQMYPYQIVDAGDGVSIFPDAR
jgi:hypothetical protein